MIALPRPRRRLAVVAISVLAALSLAGPVAAAAPRPERIDFAYTNLFTDPDVCAADGLVLGVVERVSGFAINWYASDGTWLHTTVVVEIEFDLAASNGATLFEQDRIVRQLDDQGYREVGLWEHVNGPSGMVVLDAGQLVFDWDGNVLFEPGRHDFFHQLSSFCPGFLE